MKTPSTELFQLVQSLDWQEKRFIKSCFPAKGSATFSKQFFIYLCAAKEYNEEVALNHFHFFKKGGIKHNKQVLFDFILQKLELYHSDNNEELRLHKILFQVQLLRKKKVFNKAKQLLNYAIEKAKLHNFFLLQTQLQTEHEKLAMFSANPVYFNAAKQENNKIIPSLLVDYDLERIFQQFRHEITVIDFKNNGLTASEKNKKIKSIYTFVLSHEKSNAFILLPETIRLEVQFLKYYCLLLLGDYKKATACFMIFLKNYEKRNHSNDKEKLMLHLTNGTGIGAYARDKPMLYKLNKKADGIFQSLPTNEQSELLMYHYMGVKVNVIGLLFMEHDFEKAKLMSEQLYKGVFFENNKKALLASLNKVFLINLSQIYLCCNEPKNALQTYQTITNNNVLKNVRKDLNCYNDIVGLAIFYELKMEGNIESLVRRCARHTLYKKQPTIYKSLIHFFADLLKIKDAQKAMALFHKMVHEIGAIKKADASSIGMMENIEIRYWLNSKLKELKIMKYE